MPAAKPTRSIRPPSGYEDHLSRRAAATELGFASVFKVRQLEREGRLRPVRGAMDSAWFRPAEVASVRRTLEADQTPSLGKTVGLAAARAPAPPWSDAALIAHLRGQTEGITAAPRPRTVVDLVADTGIPISRAERVYRFWLANDLHPAAEAARAARPGRTPAPAPPAAPAPATARNERRSGERLERDALLRQMRDPDPRVRSAAFDRLKKKDGQPSVTSVTSGGAYSRKGRSTVPSPRDT